LTAIGLIGLPTAPVTRRGGQGGELKLVDPVGGAVGGQCLEVPQFAEHHAHVAQVQAVQRKVHAVDGPLGRLQGDVVRSDGGDLVPVQPLRAAPAESGTPGPPGGAVA
jgi:hypothetical protein